MTELNDQELVAEFARSGSKQAFATLVTRHVNFVDSAARRFSQFSMYHTPLMRRKILNLSVMSSLIRYEATTGRIHSVSNGMDTASDVCRKVAIAAFYWNSYWKSDSSFFPNATMRITCEWRRGSESNGEASTFRPQLTQLLSKD